MALVDHVAEEMHKYTEYFLMKLMYYSITLCFNFTVSKQENVAITLSGAYVFQTFKFLIFRLLHILSYTLLGIKTK